MLVARNALFPQWYTIIKSFVGFFFYPLPVKFVNQFWQYTVSLALYLLYKKNKIKYNLLRENDIGKFTSILKLYETFYIFF